MKQKLLLIFGLIILTFSSGKAQQLITGKISEKNGSPIVGATILEKGSSNGTSTNGNGAFSLKVNKSKTRLVISSVGFQTIEIDASPGTEVSLVWKKAQ
ncbi:carboxypeptidase-like regulatory domain-containing protein [Pseudarcicella hirudinis]|uniref:carboxypeptidase-like regulatory domain-containing protein n=1 Tax=Pseudarcicella hirudinis TaxID=1079859 RepID=UPI0035EA397B